MPSPPTLHNLHLTIALYLPNPSKIQSPIPTLDTTYSLPLTRKKKKKTREATPYLLLTSKNQNRIQTIIDQSIF
ncbi:hypothetical protein PG989_004142 [Apiospora arundinis]